MLVDGVLRAVMFVVDTGAECTTIGYGDRMRLGIADDYEFDEYQEVRGFGAGGATRYGIVDGDVVFRGQRGDSPGILQLPAELLIATDPRHEFTVLGVDVLYEFRLTVENGLVELEHLDPLGA